MVLGGAGRSRRPDCCKADPTPPPPALLPAVFRPMPIDSNGTAQAPVLIATGRVPVFDAAANASTGPITACPWAPGGAMQADSQARLVTAPC